MLLRHTASSPGVACTNSKVMVFGDKLKPIFQSAETLRGWESFEELRRSRLAQAPKRKGEEDFFREAQATSCSQLQPVLTT